MCAYLQYKLVYVLMWKQTNLRCFYSLSHEIRKRRADDDAIFEAFSISFLLLILGLGVIQFLYLSQNFFPTLLQYLGRCRLEETHRLLVLQEHLAKVEAVPLPLLHLCVLPERAAQAVVERPLPRLLLLLRGSQQGLEPHLVQELNRRRRMRRRM